MVDLSTRTSMLERGIEHAQSERWNIASTFLGR